MAAQIDHVPDVLLILERKQGLRGELKTWWSRAELLEALRERHRWLKEHNLPNELDQIIPRKKDQPPSDFWLGIALRWLLFRGKIVSRNRPMPFPPPVAQPDVVEYAITEARVKPKLKAPGQRNWGMRPAFSGN